MAAKANMTFRGAWQADPNVGVHGTHARDVVNEFFNDEGASKVIFVDKTSCNFQADCQGQENKLVNLRAS